tara:strand:- start:259 stop:426 length:168 start_codon:yes stop_codon:yes gene_type:complete
MSIDRPQLVVPIPGALRFVDVDGRIHEKAMTREDLVRLAERCLVAARETTGENDV